MKALVNSPGGGERLTMSEVAEPSAAPDEALVAVRAFGLNRGELALIARRPGGWRPGQELSGVVVRAAADGSGPAAGEHVVALVENAAWAERAAVPVSRMAVLPKGVGFAAAAGLPMAGLTALRLLRRCGTLLGRDLLMTGATGGVGNFLVQLAALGGARVTAIGRLERSDWLRRRGASSVASSIDAVEGRHDVVLESVGGKSLEAAIARVRPGGRILSYGCSSGERASIDIFSFFGGENASIETYFSYQGVERSDVPADLAYLAALVRAARIDAAPGLALNWRQTIEAIGALEARSVGGKIVLEIPED